MTRPPLEPLDLHQIAEILARIDAEHMGGVSREMMVAHYLGVRSHAGAVLDALRNTRDLLERALPYVESQSSIEATRVRAYHLRAEIKAVLASVTDGPGAGGTALGETAPWQSRNE